MPRKKVKRPQGDLAFITSTKFEKPNLITRKFIRSHVMVGKNAGKSLPPRRKAQRLEDASSKCNVSISSPILNRLEETLPICRIFAPASASVALADRIEPGELQGILQLSSMAKPLLFVLEPVIFFERRNDDWIVPLKTDSAFLHCQAFAAQCFLNALQQGRNVRESLVSRSAMIHYVKAVRCLNERLGHHDESIRLSNSTIATMAQFSSFSLLSGDLVMAYKHVEALCRIVCTRGGAETFFGGSEKLFAEVVRRDLGLALTQGSKPILPTFAPVDEPLLQYPDLAPFLEPHGLPQAVTLPDTLRTTNENLVGAWNKMADFSTLINFAVETTQRISMHTFLHVMMAVMYRMIQSKFPDDLDDEAIRLGLLAFSSSAFLPWRSFGVEYVHLALALKTQLMRIMDQQREFNPKPILWLMMIGAISIFDEKDDLWLRPFFVTAVGRCSVEGWQDMRVQMKAFLWMDLVHNKPGRRVFDRLVMIEGHCNQ